MHTLVGRTTAELEQLAVALGEPAYRGRQIARWLYRRGVADIEGMTDLPAGFRDRLASSARAFGSRVARSDASADGTVKLLVELHDGERIETVYLPYDDRVSVCLSTQAGCPAGCTFCATGLGGLARNLDAGEVVEQLLHARALDPNRPITHAVYMGMGEPLLNYDETVRSARLLADEAGISARHITVSTVGVAPGILRLAEERLPVTLALSLHAPDDALRETLIPTARKWPLAQILAACRTYCERTHRNLTFEYLLLEGINDSPEQARALAGLLGDLPGNVNLIPFNHVDTARGFRRPAQERIAAFRAQLEEAGRVTTQRMERGHAISAACGQLAGMHPSGGGAQRRRARPVQRVGGEP